MHEFRRHPHWLLPEYARGHTPNSIEWTRASIGAAVDVSPFPEDPKLVSRIYSCLPNASKEYFDTKGEGMSEGSLRQTYDEIARIAQQGINVSSLAFLHATLRAAASVHAHECFSLRRFFNDLEIGGLWEFYAANPAVFLSRIVFGSMFRVTDLGSMDASHPMFSSYVKRTLLPSLIKEGVLSQERRYKDLLPVLNTVVCYVPRVASLPPYADYRGVPQPIHPTVVSTHTPAVVKQKPFVLLPTGSVPSSAAIFLRNVKPLHDGLHSIVRRQEAVFPDRRLLQYDCGKLQALDRLLRDRKAGGHRCLIFTQMSRMLDVLETWLNFNNHTYLRLDGSTKVSFYLPWCSILSL